MSNTIGTGMDANWNARSSQQVASGAGKAKKATSTDIVYEDKEKGVSVDSFLQLMIAQLKNQDFTNPMDDTQYVTQLAQFATMQQMQDLAYYSKSNYVMSLVGKDVTVAKLGVGGNVEKKTGPIEKVGFYKNEYHLYVGGKAYKLNQVMEVHGKTVADNASDKVDVSNKSIVIGKVTDTTAKIRWPLASEDEALQSKLKYTVYYSADRNMDTLDDVKQGEVFGKKYRTELSSEKITGLEPDTTYYVNVIVTDHNGKESVYSKSIIKTEEKDEETKTQAPENTNPTSKADTEKQASSPVETPQDKSDSEPTDKETQAPENTNPTSEVNAEEQARTPVETPQDKSDLELTDKETQAPENTNPTSEVNAEEQASTPVENSQDSVVETKTEEKSIPDTTPTTEVHAES